MSVQIVESLQHLAVPLERLRCLEGNPRRGDVSAVARSYRRFGQRKPIVARRLVVDGEEVGEVIAGNHQFLAAQQLGWPALAVVWTDDDDLTAKAFALADNRTSDLGTYDDRALAEMVQAIAVDSELMAAASYTEADLLALLGVAGPAHTDKDDAPGFQKLSRSKRGDLWRLGPHRLLCGDATSSDDVDRVLAGVRADLVWTDPPYGVAYVGGTGLTIMNDEVDAGKLEVMLRAAFTNAVRCTRPGACWYVASPSGPFFAVFGALLAELKVWRQTIAWVKDSLVLGRADYHGRHESIFYGWSPGGEGRRPAPMVVDDALLEGEHYDEGAESLIYGWTPGAAHRRPPTRKQDTVWECPRPRVNADHPTMKPVALIERSLQNSTEAGEVVLDLFAGSGSTLIAAHSCARIARLVELDPRYVDVICRRWQEHTHVLPVLDATGKPHDFTVDDG